MTRGPYEPDGPAGERTPGRFVGRTWVTLTCLQDRHDDCWERLRCDCPCHALTTGAYRLHMEPA